MVWLFFVTFYLKADGLPWWGWVLFVGCIIYDWQKEHREAKQVDELRAEIHFLREIAKSYEDQRNSQG
jgi:hypothetical protein